MKTAIADLNGSKFRGRELRVRRAVEEKRLEKKKNRKEEAQKLKTEDKRQ